MRPGFDDKVLADWNGLMIAALANAASAFDRPDWRAAAETAFDFVSTRMTSEGRLFHAYRAGEAKAPATASDYANMIKAALALANAENNPEYVEQACTWTHILDEHYWADDLGGYYLAADDTDDLIVRPLSGLDDAAPNANAVMVSNLVQLTLWTGEERYAKRADEILRGFGAGIAANPVAHSGLLGAALDTLGAGARRSDSAEGRRRERDARGPTRRVVAERRGAGDLARRDAAVVVTGARQDGGRRQADGLCVPRAAMLAAGDGA